MAATGWVAVGCITAVGLGIFVVDPWLKRRRDRRDAKLAAAMAELRESWKYATESFGARCEYCGGLLDSSSPHLPTCKHHTKETNV